MWTYDVCASDADSYYDEIVLIPMIKTKRSMLLCYKEVNDSLRIKSTVGLLQ